VSKIELLLRSLLVRDALSAVLTGAGFSVSREPGQYDDDSTVIIDFDVCQDPEVLRAHQQRGVKIVTLATEADSLEMNQDQIAPLSGILTYGLSADAFCAALRLICSGERVVSRDLALEPKPRAPSSRTERRSDGDRLSPREQEVLAHLETSNNRAVEKKQTE
jgi:hypothetical protein